jgi:hypothetical protein
VWAALQLWRQHVFTADGREPGLLLTVAPLSGTALQRLGAPGRAQAASKFDARPTQLHLVMWVTGAAGPAAGGAAAAEGGAAAAEGAAAGGSGNAGKRGRVVVVGPAVDTANASASTNASAAAAAAAAAVPATGAEEGEAAALRTKAAPVRSPDGAAAWPKQLLRFKCRQRATLCLRVKVMAGTQCVATAGVPLRQVPVDGAVVWCPLRVQGEKGAGGGGGGDTAAGASGGAGRGGGGGGAAMVGPGLQLNMKFAFMPL